MNKTMNKELKNEPFYISLSYLVLMNEALELKLYDMVDFYLLMLVNLYETHGITARIGVLPTSNNILCICEEGYGKKIYYKFSQKAFDNFLARRFV